LLVTVGCNLVLGIDEAACSGACDAADAAAGAVSVKDVLPGGRLPSAGAADAGEPGGQLDTGMPASLDGVARKPLDTPSTNDPDTPSTNDPAPAGLLDIIASACIGQAAGEPFCVVNQRVICNEEGRPDSVTVCADADDCLRGSGADCAACADAEAGGCLPACAANERRCEGGQLQVCNADRTGFVLQQECGDAMSCDPVGGCRLAACAPEQRRCAGDTLEVCNATGTGFAVQERCPDETTCSPDQGCVRSSCRGGEWRCQGKNLQQCDETRARFEKVQNCGSASLCDAAAGRCIQ
jgi:hypothetical protein